MKTMTWSLVSKRRETTAAKHTRRNPDSSAVFCANLASNLHFKQEGPLCFKSCFESKLGLLKIFCWKNQWILGYCGNSVENRPREVMEKSLPQIWQFARKERKTLDFLLSRKMISSSKEFSVWRNWKHFFPQPSLDLQVFHSWIVLQQYHSWSCYV